jgi:hypothetical protein
MKPKKGKKEVFSDFIFEYNSSKLPTAAPY